MEWKAPEEQQREEGISRRTFFRKLSKGDYEVEYLSTPGRGRGGKQIRVRAKSEVEKMGSCEVEKKEEPHPQGTLADYEGEKRKDAEKRRHGDAEKGNETETNGESQDGARVSGSLGASRSAADCSPICTQALPSPTPLAAAPTSGSGDGGALFNADTGVKTDAETRRYGDTEKNLPAIRQEQKQVPARCEQVANLRYARGSQSKSQAEEPDH
jgi:hypothetical protein